MTIPKPADYLTDSGLPPDLASRLQAALEAYHTVGATLATSDSDTDKLLVKQDALSALHKFVCGLRVAILESEAKRLPHTVGFSGEVTAVPRATGKDVFVRHYDDCDDFRAFVCEEGESFADIGVRFLADRSDEVVYDMSDDEVDIRDKEGGPVYRMLFETRVNILRSLCHVKGPIHDPDNME